MIRPALIAPLLMVAACDSTAPGNEGPEAGARPRATVDVGVSLGLLPSNQGGATAAARGVLALRGRCLVLEGGGDAVHLAFATAQTRWDDTARALRVGARSYKLGSRLDLGGGEFTGNADSLPWISRPPADCGPRLWIVSSIDPA